MKIRVIYENRFQYLELDTTAADQLWVSLSLGSSAGLSDEEKRKQLQSAFDAQFNRPDYNNWHKLNRHRGKSKAKSEDGVDERDSSEPLMGEVVDDRIFRKDELAREREWDDEELRAKIRAALKPDYAEMIIAIHLDGMSCIEYAASIGQKPNTVNHRLQRAEKKLREIFEKRPF